MAKEGVGGEKTEQATPKRRHEAREKGQVRKSQDVTVAVCVLAMLAVLSIMGTQMSRGSMELLTRYLSGQKTPSSGTLSAGDITSVLAGMVSSFLEIVWPVLAVAVLVGIIANVMQFGLLFSTKALMPKFSKLNPIEGIKRMFSSRALMELVKSVIKIALIVWILVGEYQSRFSTFSTIALVPLPQAISEIFSIVFAVGFKLAAVLIAIAAIDFFYQYRKFEKDLMMSKYELKLEYKQQEGDPQIKGKIKQKQRQMAMMRMMQSVPEADVVITNPTHYAVALKYDQEGKDNAPVVIAKGADNVALRIKEIAKEADVEIVENKPLARAIYDYCEIGMEIPVELYGAVAEVLSYVYRVKNKLGDK